MNTDSGLNLLNLRKPQHLHSGMIILSWLLLNKIAHGSNFACDLPFIRNGYCENIGTDIHVKCGVGYILTGSYKIPCQPRKELYSNLPSCDAIPCPVPVTSGDIKPSFIKDGIQFILPNHRVELICQSDFVPPSHNATCITNGTFSETPLPSCQAIRCTNRTISNGRITSQFLAPKTKVLIECDEGFKRDESAEILCISNSSFSGDFNSVCRAVRCDVSNIPHALNLSYSAEPKQQLHYDCHPNYEKKLHPVICKSGHKFVNDVTPECTPKTCPERDIENGKLLQAEPREAITISCDDGYQVKKEIMLTCISFDEYFPEQLPRCQEKSCLAPVIPNGETIGLDNSETILHNSSITIKCGENYQQNGASNVITCDKGEYKPTLPSCDAKPCHLPISRLAHAVNINGIPIHRDKQTYEVGPGVELAITCSESYLLDRQEPTTCISENILDPPVLPKCIPANCEEKPVIANGHVTSGFPLTPNRTLTIQCDAGYALTPDITVRCLYKNTFDPPLPRCIAQPCPKANFIVQNGTTQYPRPSTDMIQPGQTVSISCDMYYEMFGGSRVTCIAGDKTSDMPFCRPLNCYGYTIPNGRVRPTPPSMLMEVECDAGYDLVGTLSRCVAGRVRTGTTPSCLPRPCPVQHVEHGFVKPAARVQPGQTVTVTCDNNYYLSHSYPTACVTENTFQRELPRCLPSDCQVGTVEHSTDLHIRSYSPGEAIDVVCESGYRKSYQNIVRCVAGSQTSPASLPTCIAQPCMLPSIAHSDATSQRQLSPGERISVRCDQGYRISSTAQVECVTDNIFRSSLPTCQAVPCPKSSIKIPNGRVLNTGENIAPGSALQIRCNSDYTISYTGSVVCVSSDIFHPRLPSCNDRDCSRPFITNGQITSPGNTASVPPDTILTVTCDPGYDREGSRTVRCVRANTFSPDLSTVACRAKRCELNSVPAHGRFGRSSVEPGERITVICDPDYRLSFTDSVYCVTDNQYRVGAERSDLPSCLPQPCQAPRIDHGSGLGPLNPGERLTVTCNPGYVLSSETPISCVAGETFSSQPPRCLAQPCPVPKNIPHALPNSVSHINPGQRLQITCDPNYIINNPSRDVHCVTLSQFSGPIPSCSARECQLPDVPHGTWSAQILEPGQGAMLECGAGYSGTGTLHVRCISGQRLQPGTWDVRCVENCRVNKAIVPNGYLEAETQGEVRPGDKVRVRCDPEFQPEVTDEDLTCVSGTIFSPTSARGCRPVPCPVPADPENGKFDVSRDKLNPGDSLSVTCDSGYYVAGATTLTCTSGRKFSGEIPRCKPRPCQLPTITNGSTLHNSSVLLPDQRLKYRCNDGYYNNDLRNVFCVTENQFSQPLPVCKAIRCPAPDIKYGSVSSSTAPGQQVNITCDPGLQLYPPDPVFCVTDNIFHPAELPHCKAVPCIKPETVVNGEILNTDPIQPGDEIKIKCLPDFQISTAVRVACVSGDVYTTGNLHSPATFPVCSPIPCRKPVVENGVIETAGPIKPGDRVYVTCGADYDVTGPGYLECTSRNEFKYLDQTVCRPKDCVSPSIKHGRLPGPTLRPGQTVKIQCDLGYKLDCDVNVTCISADNFKPIRLPQCLPQQCERPVIRAGNVTGPTPLIPNNTLIIQCRAGYRLTSKVPVTCVTLQQYNPPLLPHCVPCE
ncbi:hypothetical protein ACHWQZ_G010591 [Mnemiopsis leidyi]